ILFMPVIPKAAVAVTSLVSFPDVEGLVDDEDAHAVTEIEQFRSGRVVAGAQGIEAHFLEEFELAFGRAGIEGGTEGAEIVVIAAAVGWDAPAIEVKSIVGGELDGTNAEGSFVGIDEAAVRGHVGAREVHRGILDVPEARIGNGLLAG